MTPEGRVKAKLKKQLTDYGCFQFWPVQTGRGMPMVDCLAWRVNAESHSSYAIEVKREGITKPTPRQAAIMREMRKVAVRTYVVTERNGELVWLEQKD
jgi:hypothetical protein